jgi:hypothetical protein
MKPIKFALLLCTAGSSFLMACGDNNEKTETHTIDSTTITNVDTGTAGRQTNIVTTPENMMVVRHKVANFQKWKASYDAHDSMRLANGVHNYVIARGVQDTSTIMVALRIDDVAKAKAFSNDPSLKEAMKKGGVTGTPSIMFHTLVYQDRSSIAPDMVRSMNMFTVKDWDTWKKSFESNRQLRADNGLVDRVYGYDVDDNHKVTAVFAITDSAKANAFWKSDLIKQKRTEAGIVGQPEMFMYRVVQMY